MRFLDSHLKAIAVVVGAITMGAAEALSAQTDTLATAAAVITAEAVARHVGVIADDSMGERETPSPGLAKTARYVAEQFRRFGLEPGANAWIQDYTVAASSRMTLNYETSRLYCSTAARDGQGTGNEANTTVTFASGAYFAVDSVLESGRLRAITADSVIAISGRQSPAAVAAAHLHGHIVLYLPAPGVDSATERQVLHALYAENRVLILSRDDSAAFARRQHDAARRQIRVADENAAATAPYDISHWALAVRPAALQSCLEHVGVNLDQWQSDTLPGLHPLPGLAIWSVPRYEHVTEEIENGMNVVGVVPGSGFVNSANGAPRGNGVIVVSAHMDQVSPGPKHGDRQGVNDNASGVAVLLELAHAFGRLDRRARPHRSIIFLATSGERQLRGVTAWIGATASDRPMVNVNLDMLGRPAGDSVWVDGLRDVDWPVRADWLAALYPEWGVTVVDGGSIAHQVSDHFAFMRRFVPCLYFYDDAHLARVFDPAIPAGLDLAQTARIGRFLFHLLYQLGNTAEDPQWTAEGRRDRTAALEHP